MNVWLLHVGEDLPVDQGGRVYRYGRLATALAERGHRVTRWAPTVRHATKTQRADTHRRIAVSQRYDLQLLRSRDYHANIGFARWRSYRGLVASFVELAAETAPPDLIVSAIPTVAWSHAAIGFGARHGVPVVVDVRDLWPDVYLTAAPRALRPVARWALGPAYRQAADVCRRATALMAVSETYLEWALDLADRTRETRDAVVPIGHSPVTLSDDDRLRSEAWLQEHGVRRDKTLCVYAGLLETSYDLPTVIEAAACLESAGRDDVQFVICGAGSRMDSLRKQAEGLRNVQFVICGAGSRMDSLRKQAEGLRNVLLLGWVEGQTLQTLMSWSRIGLAAYAGDALQSLPNKPFEYLSAGLAVLSSLRGELAAILSQHRCGSSYRAGDAVGLADQIAGLLDAPERLAEMGRRGLELFSERYASGVVYPAAVEHLERVAATRTGTRPSASLGQLTSAA